MSMELMVKAFKMTVGNPLRKLVLIKLADNANDKGECWPSYQHIADQCEVGRSTVKGHIRALEDMGLLRREFRKNGDLNQSNVFHLSLEDAPAKANAGGGAGADPGQEMPRWGYICLRVGQELTQGVGQELPPESVTLLNQSKNQSLNLNILVHRLKPVYLQSGLLRNIHQNSKAPGRYTQNAPGPITNQLPGKHGLPVSKWVYLLQQCWQVFSAMQRS
ncbi:hypothetical protein ABMA09_18785 [Erwinia rhapontici]